MKRIISLVLAFALLLVGCGSAQSEQTTSVDEEKTTENVVADQGDDGLGDKLVLGLGYEGGIPKPELL